MLELLLRGLAIGILLAAALNMLRGGAVNDARWSGALFCVATAGFVAHTSATIPALIGALRHVAWLLSAGGTAYFWMFGMALFAVDRLRPMHALPVLLMTTLVLTGRMLPAGGDVGTEIAHNLLEVVLVVHVLHAIWRTRGDDLIDGRRALRVPFMAAVGTFCIVLSGFDVAWSLGYQAPWVKTLQAALLVLMTLGGVWTFGQGRPDMFERGTVRRGRAASAPDAGHAEATDAIPAADRLLLDRLQQLLDGTDFWRQSGLTIGQLADRLGIPEHRLRVLINRILGYRNFSDFLNEKRIAAAKAELRDPAKAGVQISTIAFGLGYASLGPFNRAFREATGTSPREWRAQGADGEQSSPIPE